MELRERIIDGLALKSPVAWTFYSFGGLIVGQRDSRVGALQVSLAFRSALEVGAGHAECRNVLTEFASCDDFSNRGAWGSETHDGAVAGAVTWVEEGTFTCAWYRLTGRGRVLALYQCPNDRVVAAESEIEECDTIARTLEFVNRPKPWRQKRPSAAKSAICSGLVADATFLNTAIFRMLLRLVSELGPYTIRCDYDTRSVLGDR